MHARPEIAYLWNSHMHARPEIAYLWSSHMRARPEIASLWNLQLVEFFFHLVFPHFVTSWKKIPQLKLSNFINLWNYAVEFTKKFIKLNYLWNLKFHN